MFLGFKVNSCRPIDKRLFSKDNMNSIDYKNNIIKRPIHSNTYLNLLYMGSCVYFKFDSLCCHRHSIGKC